MPKEVWIVLGVLGFLAIAYTFKSQQDRTDVLKGRVEELSKQVDNIGNDE